MFLVYSQKHQCLKIRIDTQSRHSTLIKMNPLTNNVASQYKYSVNSVFLTNTQRQFYEDNGYIIFRNLVDDGILDECKQRFIDVCNDEADTRPVVIMKDMSLRSKNVQGEFLINKIQDFVHDEIFLKYISFAPMVDIVSSIIGSNITVFHSMLVNKPPDADENTSKHPIHQDLHYFPFRPANAIVASWTAMERINEKNGCLFAVPGSHKGHLYKHDYPPNMKNKAYHGIIGLDNIPRVNLVMEKGDTVFFHPLLLHGSGPNLTKGFRKAISCHYADSNSHFIDVRGTSQDNIREEIQAMGDRLGLNTKFEDIWKLKSRLVRGQPGSFQQLSSNL